uniref:Uncharacterized protein n=1 Tax=Panagrolaimus sp. JU765 TaxID=591449 RepID=A0AC34R9L2_9BILA
MDPVEIQQVLKASKITPNGKPRSNSCPRDSVGWIHPMISYDASAGSLYSTAMNSPSVIPEEPRSCDETKDLDFLPEKSKTQRSISEDSDSVVVEVEEPTNETATIPENSHHPIFYIKQ